MKLLLNRPRRKKGYSVLVERQGVEVGQPGQPEVVSQQVVVDHQLLQLGEQSEAGQRPATRRPEEKRYGSKSAQLFVRE